MNIRQDHSMNLPCICLKVVLHISTFYSRSENLNLGTSSLTKPSVF